MADCGITKRWWFRSRTIIAKTSSDDPLGRSWAVFAYRDRETIWDSVRLFPTAFIADLHFQKRFRANRPMSWSTRRGSADYGAAARGLKKDLAGDIELSMGSAPYMMKAFETSDRSERL